MSDSVSPLCAAIIVRELIASETRTASTNNNVLSALLLIMTMDNNNADIKMAKEKSDAVVPSAATVTMTTSSWQTAMTMTGEHEISDNHEEAEGGSPKMQSPTSSTSKRVSWHDENDGAKPPLPAASTNTDMQNDTAANDDDGYNDFLALLASSPSKEPSLHTMSPTSSDEDEHDELHTDVKVKVDYFPPSAQTPSDVKTQSRTAVDMLYDSPDNGHAADNDDGHGELLFSIARRGGGIIEHLKFPSSSMLILRNLLCT